MNAEVRASALEGRPLISAAAILRWLAEFDEGLAREPEAVWGDTALPVDRLVLAWSASADVLEAAAAQSGRTLILTRAHPFYAPPTGFDPAIVPSREGWAGLIGEDVVAAAKRELLADHQLVLAAAPWLWDLRSVEDRSLALSYRLALGDHLGEAGATTIVSLRTPRRVSELADQVAAALCSEHVLVLGDTDRLVSRAAIGAGVISPGDVALALEDELVDVIIAGELVEWEAAPYAQDAIAAGRKFSLIAVGNALSENPATEALASALERHALPIPVVAYATRQAAWAVRKVVA